LSDGRPGHFNKSKTILRALRQHYAVAETWMEIRLRLGLFRYPVAVLINGTAPSKAFSYALPLLYSGYKTQGKVDLVLSTGGNTLYANVLISRAHDCRSFFVGHPRSVRPEKVWRILHPHYFEPSPPFIHWPRTLVDIEVKELEQEARQKLPKLTLPDESLCALLVGGNGGGYTYTRQDFIDLAKMVESTSQSRGIRWLVVSSRRTGEENEKLLRSLIHPDCLAGSSWTTDKGPNLYRAFLGAASKIVCTEDSEMMMAEGIEAGKPVCLIRPDRGQSAHEDRLKIYEAEGSIERMTIQHCLERGPHWPTSKRSTHDQSLTTLGNLLAREWESANQTSWKI